VTTPPRLGPVDRLRSLWASRNALGRIPRWLVTRAAPVVLVCVALFVVNGFLAGWVTAYDVLIGITSPSAVSPSWCAWPLSLVGWAMLPALIGGVVGHVVAQQVETHHARELDDVLSELRQRASLPPRGGS
jgi:hypothetical protein